MSLDLLASIADLISAFEPQDERTAASKTEILESLQRLPSPFSETADPTHVTASAAVRSSAGVLLHRHKRLGIWVGPGGHLEEGESPTDAVLRETLEETGVVARHPAGGPRLIHVDVHPGPKGHRHLDLRWLLLADPVGFVPGAGESPEIRWVEREEALSLVPVDFRPVLAAAFEEA